MTSCIYHGDKVSFDKVRKDLQRVKILPRKYGPRLAMAVCSCRKKGNSLDSQIQEDMSFEQSLVQEEMNLPKWQAFPETRTFIQCFAKLPRLGVSQTKFLLVFCKAMNGDFEALEEEMKNSREKKEEYKKHKMNQTGLAKLINRKKKSCPVKAQVILPIFGGNTKQLETETGRGFCRTGKRFDCVVRYESDMTREFMNAEKQKTAITVWCKSKESLGEIHRYLHTLANNIQAELTKKHEKEVKKRVEMRRLRKQIYETQDMKVPVKSLHFETNRKELMSDDYEKKKNKDQKHKTYHHVNKAELSPLWGGHCLNCFMLFDSLNTDNEDTCTYHRGYLVRAPGTAGFRWTCCHFYEINKEFLHDMHSRNGCHQGRHVWRPHQKASRGDKSERRYLQRMLKRK